MTRSPVQVVSTATYGRLQLSADELGLPLEEARQLPWARAGVARVNATRLGVELEVGGYAGRLVVHDDLIIEVEEMVPGTASACLALSTTGRRQGLQSAGPGPRVAPQQALAKAFVAAHEALMSRGRLKEYVAQDDLTGRPRGKLLVGATVRGPWAHGRTDHVWVRRRPLSEDTPLNRLLLAAAVRAERLLEHPRQPELLQACRGTAAAGGARLVQHPVALSTERHWDAEVEGVAALARTLLLGVPVLPREPHDSSPFTTWVNLDRLFEEAVRRVCERACPPGAVRAGRTEKTTLLRRKEGDPELSSRRADPDIVVRAGGRVLVLDAKYRRAGERAGEAELYQLLAHAGAFDADAAALITPALHGPPATSRLGRDARGCTVDILAVDPSDARQMDRAVRRWLDEQQV